MKDIKPRLHVVHSKRAATPLSAPEAALVNDMLMAWERRRIGGLRHTRRSFNNDLSRVLELIGFTSKPPWRWTVEDFDAWCAHLANDRKVAMSTERTYQSAIRGFLEFATTNVRFRADVSEKFGCTFVQICDDTNCIPHQQDREQSDERRALTHDEVAQFFSGIDRAIEEAARFSGKDLLPLQRDKAFYSCVYYLGGRITEIIRINSNSFLPNAEFPEFGNYGRITLWGKGSHGSGPKPRPVIVDHEALPPIMDWYVNEVRPRYLRNADPNEDAMFLNERGGRVKIGGMEARFHKLLANAGLEGRDFVPHCLRHSAITHGSMWMDPLIVQQKAGHKYFSTTQTYTHIPQEHLREEQRRSIDKMIKEAKAHEGGDEEPPIGRTGNEGEDQKDE